MSDKLEGWAYPLNQKVLGYYIADHAYVKAPNNGPAYFNCWGGHSGDHQYQVDGGTGNGNYAMANCYRGPEVMAHTDTAYVVPYGVDGVCHQSANRFLYSACPWVGPAVVVTNPVHGVRGGIASVLAFGVYGHSLAAFLVIYGKCKTDLAAKVVESPAEESNPQNFFEELGRLHADLADSLLKGNEHDPLKLIRSEFDIVIKHAIGNEFVTDKIAELQTALFKERISIAESSVKGEDFAHKINDAVNVSLRGMATHLGKDQYRKLFDLDPDVPLILVRPEITAVTRK